MKSKDMRISGLDDLIRSEDVREAIVKATGCPLGTVRVGGLRMSVAAARKIAQTGRLCVGWASAN